MKRKRVLNFANSEKRKLIREVTFLCRELDRPISSSDLRKHFRKYPERMPNLLQRYGQLLIKAARPVPDPIPKIYAIGIFKNNVFYAPDTKRDWNRTFADFVLQQKLTEQLKIRILDRALYLIRTPCEKMARNALAGWLLEMEGMLKELRCSKFPEYKEVIQNMNEARTYAAKKYVLQKPRLIKRREATKLILREFHKRNPETDRPPSLARYLARLRWQPSSECPLYSKNQIKAFVAGRWPYKDEDPFVFQSLEIILKYIV